MTSGGKGVGRVLHYYRKGRIREKLQRNEKESKQIQKMSMEAIALIAGSDSSSSFKRFIHRITAIAEAPTVVDHANLPFLGFSFSFLIKL